MPPMNTTWRWSSQACATSDIEFIISPLFRSHLRVSLIVLSMVLLIACTLFCPAYANVIQAGQNVQEAINSANAGDIIMVSAEEAGRFEVDRPITIEGLGGPIVSAALQKPAIIVRSDGVTIRGFRIRGVGKDTTAKFNYYMQNPMAAANSALDQPNIGILVRGDGVTIANCSIFGSQTGISAEKVRGLALKNVSIDTCDTGASILECRGVSISGTHATGCKKYGLDIELSKDVRLEDNSIANNTNGGILLKGSQGCTISNNSVIENTFGLSLWNSSYCQVRGNLAKRNYYGILVTDWSNYNNITDNTAQDNSRSEIINGFGIGISLQENSSNNLLMNNRASGNFNGLEISRGCHHNAVYGNNATENEHGLRMNENRNNLIYCNNFIKNKINAYENVSMNIWNTTLGNYYDDYEGADSNGDGIGDKPRPMPGPESETADMRPLMRPANPVPVDYATPRSEVERYAHFSPPIEPIPTTSLQNGVVVISKRRASAPPKWSESDSFDPSAETFKKEISL